MGDCFIIMPISTPAERVDAYKGDADHFRHVLDHLFVPAVEKAGHNPIRPSATGADLIHAEIVKNLETADLVLCDMSTQNANVFFELGIRTSLNKPVCLVKDSLTRKVPFDTGLLNYHTYDVSLATWILEKEVEDLVAHLKASEARCDGGNPLWKYFGLTTRAERREAESPVEDKLDLILRRLENSSDAGSLRRPTDPVEYGRRVMDRVMPDILDILREEDVMLDGVKYGEHLDLPYVTLVLIGDRLSHDAVHGIQRLAGRYKCAVGLEYPPFRHDR